MIFISDHKCHLNIINCFLTFAIKIQMQNLDCQTENQTFGFLCPETNTFYAFETE